MINDDPSLSVLAPIKITPAMLISSTAPETDYPVWSNATNYVVGDRVMLDHHNYEAQKAGAGHNPSDPNNQFGTTVWWLDLGATNRWAMFDNSVSTQTLIASPLTVVVTPGFYNSLFMGGLDAENYSISIKDAPGGTVVFSRSGVLENSAPPDYYEHFFDPFRPQTDLLVNDIPPYHMSELTVTLTKPSGQAGCGILAVGDLKPLGETQYGATAEPKDYSYVSTDKFGRTSIVKRTAALGMSATSEMDLEDANYVLSVMTSLLSVPCVWVGTNIPMYSGLRSFGLGSGKMTYDKFGRATFSLTVQGMI